MSWDVESRSVKQMDFDTVLSVTHEKTDLLFKQIIIYFLINIVVMLG